MKKLLLIVPLALSLGACASLQVLQSDVSNAFGVLTGTSIPPTALIVAANSFDAAEATATNYLVYCKSNPAVQPCALSNRQAVVKAVRAGLVLRGQLESYISNGTSAPPALYQEILGIISSVQSVIPQITGASK